MTLETARQVTEIWGQTAPFLVPFLMAFQVWARKEIGKRDEWQCQGVNSHGCSMAYLNSGEPLNFQSGFYVVAAHYPDRHHLSGKGYHDTDTDNGRILCSTDHAIEEFLRGNVIGARKQLQSGIYHWNFMDETGIAQVYFDLDDIRDMILNKPEFFELEAVV